MVELTTDTQPSPKKIGIFGGTFDPVHRGHLTLAQVASHQFSLDLVIWVPTGVPFHKNSHGLLIHSPPPSAYENRLSMVQLAIAPIPTSWFPQSRLIATIVPMPSIPFGDSGNPWNYNMDYANGTG